MVIEYIRYQLGADRAPALIDAYAAARECLAASQHSLGYDVAQCADDAGAVTVRMAWDSADGHLQGFRQSPQFGRFLELVRPFVGDIQEMRHYTVVAGPGFPTELVSRG